MMANSMEGIQGATGAAGAPVEPGAPSPLEDGHHDAVGGADREQVQQDGLRRHRHGTEADEEKKEADGQDPEQHHRKALGGHRGKSTLPAVSRPRGR